MQTNGITNIETEEEFESFCRSHANDTISIFQWMLKDLKNQAMARFTKENELPRIKKEHEHIENLILQVHNASQPKFDSILSTQE